MKSTPFQDLLDKRGWSQVELAERSGVSVRTIYQIRYGLVANARAATIRRLAKALRVTTVTMRELVVSEAARC